jgi:hypothetical protein
VRRIDRGKTCGVQASAARREKARPNWRGTHALAEAEQAHGAGAYAAWLGHVCEHECGWDLAMQGYLTRCCPCSYRQGSSNSRRAVASCLPCSRSSFASAAPRTPSHPCARHTRPAPRRQALDDIHGCLLWETHVGEGDNGEACNGDHWVTTASARENVMDLAVRRLCLYRASPGTRHQFDRGVSSLEIKGQA